MDSMIADAMYKNRSDMNKEMQALIAKKVTFKDSMKKLLYKPAGERAKNRNNQGICDACWYAILKSER